MTIINIYGENEILINGEKYLSFSQIKKIFYEDEKFKFFDTDEMENYLSCFRLEKMTLEKRNESTWIYKEKDIKIIEPLFKEFLKKKAAINLNSTIDKISFT